MDFHPPHSSLLQREVPQARWRENTRGHPGSGRHGQCVTRANNDDGHGSFCPSLYAYSLLTIGTTQKPCIWPIENMGRPVMSHTARWWCIWPTDNVYASNNMCGRLVTMRCRCAQVRSRGCRGQGFWGEKCEPRNTRGAGRWGIDTVQWENITSRWATTTPNPVVHPKYPDSLVLDMQRENEWAPMYIRKETYTHRQHALGGLSEFSGAWFF